MKIFLTLMALATIAGQPQEPTFIEGAWSFRDSSGHDNVLILADKHFVVATYDLAGKLFISTRGGKYRFESDKGLKKMIEKIEFNTANPETVGSEQSVFFADMKRHTELLGLEGVVMKRLDDGTPGRLAGAWVITGRMSADGMRKMTPGARRTMKILSGTRFQWIAYNVETKEFSGTGGGTYSTIDGKYTENIEFFSRDNSRAGSSLNFDYAIEGTAWRHKGLSSKGEPIDEVWSRRTEIGL